MKIKALRLVEEGGGRGREGQEQRRRKGGGTGKKEEENWVEKVKRARKNRRWGGRIYIMN